MLVIGLVKAFKITTLINFPAVFIGVKAVGFFFKQRKFKRVYISYQNSCPQVIKLIKSDIDALVPYP